MTEPIGLFYDALQKIEEAREDLEKGLPKGDRDAANVIFKAMCDANLQYMDTAKTIQHLAMASLLYSQAVLRQHMSAQATTISQGDNRRLPRSLPHPPVRNSDDRKH